jgi:ABC-type transporter MlaC component
MLTLVLTELPVQRDYRRTGKNISDTNRKQFSQEFEDTLHKTYTVHLTLNK